MIISAEITIHDNEIRLDFIRASGPGGQNVNKVSTAVQLRFEVKESSSISSDIKARLKQIAGKKMTEQGVLILEAKRYRSQEKNRQDVLERFAALIRKASEKPKTRVKTRQSRASKERILAAKRHLSKVKKNRRKISSSDE